MDQAVLVNLDIERGSRVVAALDSENRAPEVALLASLPQYETWRLVIASSTLKGHEDLVASLREAGIQASERPSVLLYSIEDSFIKDLRAKYAGKIDSLGTHLNSQKFGNQYIEDAFVYRIR